MQTTKRKPMPPKVKRKISESLKGRPLTKRHRYKIGVALRKKSRELRLHRM